MDVQVAEKVEILVEEVPRRDEAIDQIEITPLETTENEPR